MGYVCFFRGGKRHISLAPINSSFEIPTSPEVPVVGGNESPFFAFEIELEMLTRIKCPLHGERFKPLYHLHVAKWLRAKQPQHLWTHHSEQYRKAWFVSFPPKFVAG